jgi:hypothetical protein
VIYLAVLSSTSASVGTVTTPPPRRLLSTIALLAVMLVATACVPKTVVPEEHDVSMDAVDDLPADAVEALSVTYALPADDLTDGQFDAMEQIADEAEQIAVAHGGFSDGVGAGAGTYDVYFFAPDGLALWNELEELMRTAPLPLIEVAILPEDEDAAPIIVFDADEIAAT